MRFVQRDYPLGGIFVWSGSVASIPGTFRLCDGTLGTPDLRNRFIVGANDTYAINATGGSILHNHDFTSNTHIHAGEGSGNIKFGADLSDFLSSEVITGTTNNRNGLPPYFAKAYIMYAGRVH